MAKLTQEMQANKVAGGSRTANVDLKFEVVVIPVSDVDRAKEFYARLGWRFDIDSGINSDYRLVQFTPPGSSCSIIFGKNVTTAAPGSAQGLYLIVSDIDAAIQELVGLGIEMSGPFHGTMEPTTPTGSLSVYVNIELLNELGIVSPWILVGQPA